MSKGAHLRIAAAILGLLSGMAAAPARAESESATDETDPEVEVPVEAPTMTMPPMSDPDAQPMLTPRRVHRRRPGLIAAGAATFAVSYGVALFLGLATVGSGAAEECSDCGSHGATAVVPVAGPLLYWWKSPAYVRGSPVWWSIWSGVQAVGVGMLIAGLVGHDVVEWRPRYLGARVSVVPLFAPNVGALSLNVSW